MKVSIVSLELSHFFVLPLFCGFLKPGVVAVEAAGTAAAGANGLGLVQASSNDASGGEAAAFAAGGEADAVAAGVVAGERVVVAVEPAAAAADGVQGQQLRQDA